MSIQTTLKTRTGVSKTVRYGDPVWDTLDNKRVRFNSETPDGMIEVLDDQTGKVLPDLRHPTQVWAY